MTDFNTLLVDLYYHKHNYDGAINLYRKAKLINPQITQTDVTNWLLSQPAYQQNFSKLEKKKFLPIYSEMPDAYQIDLTFIPQFKKQNDGNYVLFTAIGVNTRYAYASYASNKTASTVLALFKTMLETLPVNHITGDLGSEFTNKSFIDYLNQRNIEYNFFKSDSSKLGIINRFHRTLKSKLTNHITATGSVKWITVLDDVIKNINETYNRGIKQRPIDVYDSSFLENSIIADKKSQTAGIHENSIAFTAGDKVRVLYKQVLFANKMKPKYSDEVYTVVSVRRNTLYLEMDHVGTHHVYKKSRVIKVTDSGGNAPAPPPTFAINRAIQENRIIRRIRHEDLINEPQPRRTRNGPLL